MIWQIISNLKKAECSVTGGRKSYCFNNRNGGYMLLCLFCDAYCIAECQAGDTRQLWALVMGSWVVSACAWEPPNWAAAVGCCCLQAVQAKRFVPLLGSRSRAWGYRSLSYLGAGCTQRTLPQASLFCTKFALLAHPSVPNPCFKEMTTFKTVMRSEGAVVPGSHKFKTTLIFCWLGAIAACFLA